MNRFCDNTIFDKKSKEQLPLVISTGKQGNFAHVAHTQIYLLPIICLFNGIKEITNHLTISVFFLRFCTMYDIMKYNTIVESPLI